MNKVEVKLGRFFLTNTKVFINNQIHLGFHSENTKAKNYSKIDSQTGCHTVRPNNRQFQKIKF